MISVATPTICVHVFPKKEEDGIAKLHIVDNGADCHCEPICEVRFDPERPKIPILIVVHRQDLIGVAVLGHLPPSSKKNTKDYTPPPDFGPV